VKRVMQTLARRTKNNPVIIGKAGVGKQQVMGFRRDGDSVSEREQLRSSIENALEKTLGPELLNRIDEIVIFDPLRQEEMQGIVDLLVLDVEQRLDDRKIKLEISGEAKSWLVKQGFDPVFGARPLRRSIQRYVENPLSNQILSGDIKDGDAIKVDISGEGLSFNVMEYSTNR